MGSKPPRSGSYQTILPSAPQNDSMSLAQLSEAERYVVGEMRRMQAQSVKPLLSIQYLGDSWRIYLSNPGKWLTGGKTT